MVASTDSETETESGISPVEVTDTERRWNDSSSEEFAGELPIDVHPARKMGVPLPIVARKRRRSMASHPECEEKKFREGEITIFSPCKCHSSSVV
ncbi:hypothetical protein [Saliphagus sp. LR7]|uniref:hypothetical protein n=1 Tax=Saliphagus sp. LR7 TaxID=2282654 RepID=UPI001300612C|nr:hypothetical protein [Saliphagus sp. LR7]